MGRFWARRVTACVAVEAECLAVVKYIRQAGLHGI